MATNNSKGEPSTAPQPNKWYNITLGASFKDNHHHSPKFCTLRYEFKPASIDSSQPGSLHKTEDNRVTVEFQNNQHGKPKVKFEGVGEDYKDNDAVLFFDGETFRLERLHRAVKRLRHLRLPGETAPLVSAGPAAESYSILTAKGTQIQTSSASIPQPVQEQFDLNNSDNLDPDTEKQQDHDFSHGDPPTASQKPSGYESEEIVNIDDDDADDDDEAGPETAKAESGSEKEFRTGGLDIDINLPHPAEADDEIADVDMNDEEADKGLNAAEALRAQVNAEAREKQQTSSSSSGSESWSSGSGSDSESGSETSSSGSQSSGSGSKTASESGPPS